MGPAASGSPDGQHSHYMGVTRGLGLEERQPQQARERKGPTMRGAGAESENRQVGRTGKVVERETLETWAGNSEEKETVRGLTTGLREQKKVMETAEEERRVGRRH